MFASLFAFSVGVFFIVSRIFGDIRSSSLSLPEPVTKSVNEQNRLIKLSMSKVKNWSMKVVNEQNRSIKTVDEQNRSIKPIDEQIRLIKTVDE